MLGSPAFCSCSIYLRVITNWKLCSLRKRLCVLLSVEGLFTCICPWEVLVVWSYISRNFSIKLTFWLCPVQKESKTGLFSYIWERIVPLHVPQPLPFHLLDYIPSVYTNGYCYMHFYSTALVLTSPSLGVTVWCQIVIWCVCAHVMHLQHSVPCFLPPPLCLKISSKKKPS